MSQRVNAGVLRAPLLMAAAYVALGAAWLGSNPPGAAPDEPAHYLRALAIGRGDFLGEPVGDVTRTRWNAEQAAHLARVTRSVLVPVGLAVPPSWLCTVANSDESARCLTASTTNASPVRQTTTMAGYVPYLYIPPGLAIRLAGNPTQALFLARLANALVTYGFLLGVILLLWDGTSALSVLGVPLAITPMVLFIGTATGPSGPEIGAAAAFLAFLLRLTRTAQAPRWAWALGIAAGAVLTLARALGPLWTVSIVVVVIAFAGRSQCVAVARRAPLRSAFGGGILVATAALSLGWMLAFLPPAPHPPSELAGFLLPSVAAIPEAVGEAIGVFGWVNTLMPRGMYAVWGIALILLVAPALLRGRLRERRAVDGLVMGVGAAIVLVSAFVELPTGFAVQGRHILPVFLALPLVSGELLYRNHDRVGASSLAWIAAVTGTLAAIVQFAGWYANAHRYAVGTAGPWLFLGDAEWSPPGGWVPWLALATSGAAFLVIAAFTARQLLPGRVGITSD